MPKKRHATDAVVEYFTTATLDEVTLMLRVIGGIVRTRQAAPKAAAVVGVRRPRATAGPVLVAAPPAAAAAEAPAPIATSRRRRRRRAAGPLSVENSVPLVPVVGDEPADQADPSAPVEE